MGHMNRFENGSVSRTVRPTRSNRGWPNSTSSLMICWLSVGCVTQQASAARVKLPISAALAK